MTQLIGNSLGSFVDLPKSQDSIYCPFFRFQVLVDVTKLLKRGMHTNGVLRYQFPLAAKWGLIYLLLGHSEAHLHASRSIGA